MSDQAKHLDKRDHWIEAAADLINRAAGVMTVEQLSQWHGCRAVIETKPEPNPDLLEACKALNHLTIETCNQCDGTGHRHGDLRNDACHHCGGVGEIVQGHFHPDDLRAIRSAIQKATK